MGTRGGICRRRTFARNLGHVDLSFDPLAHVAIMSFEDVEERDGELTTYEALKGKQEILT